MTLSLERGSRECRMRAAPAVSREKQVTKTHTNTQVQRRRSDIPCAMALRLITRSPRRRIRLVTVVGELAASPRPVGPACLRQLDTSNGCQNHTTSPYASAPFVSTPFDRSRVWLNPKHALPFTCMPPAPGCLSAFSKRDGRDFSLLRSPLMHSRRSIITCAHLTDASNSIGRRGLNLKLRPQVGFSANTQPILLLFKAK